MASPILILTPRNAGDCHENAVRSSTDPWDHAPGSYLGSSVRLQVRAFLGCVLGAETMKPEVNDRLWFDAFVALILILLGLNGAAAVYLGCRLVSVWMGWRDIR
jgi:hypothetical protein